MFNPIKEIRNHPRFGTSELRKREYKRLLFIVIGAFIYSFFVNNFIVPLGVYSGGFMGMAQIIRTLINRAFGLQRFGFDYAGIINFCLNIPLYVLAFKSFSKIYVFRGFLFTIAQTIFLTIIPIPSHPIVTDILTNAIIGGAGCGLAGGLVLRNGANGGGTDMVSSLLIKKHQNISLSLVSNTINFFVYGTMLFLFGPSKVVYSAIQSVMGAMVADKVFIQNITTEVHIIVDEESVDAIKDEILKKLNRGVTYWSATGGYTGSQKVILYTIVSKYELQRLIWIVKKIDPHALVVENAGARISGNFQKRLE